MFPLWLVSAKTQVYYFHWLLICCSVWFCGFLCFGALVWWLCYLRNDRLHWVEFHETKRCPAFIKKMVRISLVVGWDSWGLGALIGSLSRSVASEMARAVTRGGYSAVRVLDMCSGGGGPTPVVHSQLCRKLRAARTVMTDLFPETALLEAACGEHRDLSFCNEPVDAMRVANTKSLMQTLTAAFDSVNDTKEKAEMNERDTDADTSGRLLDSEDIQESDVVTLRTIHGSFHHFKPAQTVALLSDAIQHGHGFVVCEPILRRNSVFDFWETIFGIVLPVPLMLLNFWAHFLTSPTESIWRKLWNCVLSVLTLPIWLSVLLHDGVISCARTYSVQQLKELPLIARADALRHKSAQQLPDYDWDVFEKFARLMVLQSFSVGRITYLIGIPRKKAAQ